MERIINYREHRENTETAHQAPVVNFFAFCVIVVVKNQAKFWTTGQWKRVSGGHEKAREFVAEKAGETPTANSANVHEDQMHDS